MSIQDTNSLKDAFFGEKQNKDKALSNQFKLVYKSFYKAGYLTTDPNQFPKSNQYKMF
jgi:hypothetical protein